MQQTALAGGIVITKVNKKQKLRTNAWFVGSKQENRGYGAGIDWTDSCVELGEARHPYNNEKQLAAQLECIPKHLVTLDSMYLGDVETVTSLTPTESASDSKQESSSSAPENAQRKDSSDVWLVKCDWVPNDNALRMVNVGGGDSIKVTLSFVKLDEAGTSMQTSCDGESYVVDLQRIQNRNQTLPMKEHLKEDMQVIVEGVVDANNTSIIRAKRVAEGNVKWE